MVLDLSAFEWALKAVGAVLFILLLYRASKPEELYFGGLNFFVDPIDDEDNEESDIDKIRRKLKNLEQSCYRKAEEFDEKHNKNKSK